MENGTLTITRDADHYLVSIAGRANFATVVPLREFAGTPGLKIARLTVDLGQCLSMDSTCMGVLSMIALTAIRQQAKLVLCNAGSNRQLLKGLGVERLFQFEERECPLLPEPVYPAADTAAAGRLETAETVLEAHQTLIHADSANHARFDTVVKLAENDVSQLRKPDQQ